MFRKHSPPASATAAPAAAPDDFSRFFDCSVDAMLVCGFNGYIKRHNPATETITGFTHHELTSQPFLSLVHPDDKARAVAELLKLFAGGTKSAFEVRILTKSGAYIWAMLSGTGMPLRLEFYLVGTDVTARHEAEEALAESEEHTRVLLDSAAEGIYGIDLNGRCTFSNAACRRMTGHDRAEDLLGQDLHSVLHHSHADGTPLPVEKCRIYSALRLGREEHVSDEVLWRRDGTFFPAEYWSHPIRKDGQVTGCVVSFVDITERRRAEEELRQAKEGAEAASRAKSEFLAVMSHEIRTPMNGIIGLTTLLLDTDLSAEQRQYADGALHSAESLLKLINDILDFSKIEAGRIELDRTDFDLRETLGNTIKTLALRAHEKGLELLYEVRPDVPDALIGDAARLWQVVINLVGNAIKFTPRGEVSIVVETERATADSVSLQFNITDTGVGISSDKQRFLFTPFFQADTSMSRKYGGTGLGLAIAAQLVHLMGGRIWCESELGVGSNFHFTARFGRRPVPVAKRAPLPPSRLDGLRVLVVDDNETNRRILHDMLVHWGMQPAEADGGRGAIDDLVTAARANEPFSLVLLDAMMPDMDGFAVLEKLAQIPEINRPVILMLSSAEGPGDAARARALGAAGYLVKPIAPSDLLEMILKVLGIALEANLPAAPHTFPSVPGELRVLLVEDNPVNQLFESRVLEKAGYTVEVTGNGQEALAALARDSFDIVLMDVQMPVMDGFEATALIRQQEKATGRHLPIVAMTAHAMERDRDKCLAAGMDGYVAKPVQLDELFAAIDAAVPPQQRPGRSLLVAATPGHPNGRAPAASAAAGAEAGQAANTDGNTANTQTVRGECT